jgi:hypothetical protein
MTWTWPWTQRITQTDLKELIMAAIQNAVDQIVTQLGHAKDEILAKVADLETQITAGETPDLGPLTAAAQALDDIVPDAVTPTSE